VGLTVTVTLGAILVTAAIIVAATVRECSREIAGAIEDLAPSAAAASPWIPPERWDACERSIAREHAADEDMERLLRSHGAPIDPRDARLWAKQILDPDSDDRIHAEARRDT
jgi:hypothetical protein